MRIISAKKKRRSTDYDDENRVFVGITTCKTCAHQHLTSKLGRNKCVLALDRKEVVAYQSVTETRNALGLPVYHHRSSRKPASLTGSALLCFTLRSDNQLGQGGLLKRYCRQSNDVCRMGDGSCWAKLRLRSTALCPVCTGWGTSCTCALVHTWSTLQSTCRLRLYLDYSRVVHRGTHAALHERKGDIWHHDTFHRKQQRLHRHCCDCHSSTSSACVSLRSSLHFVQVNTGCCPLLDAPLCSTSRQRQT